MKTLARKWPVAREHLDAAKDAIARATAAQPRGSLRVKWRRLAQDEQTQLVELVKQASAGGGFMFEALDKRAGKKLEALLEKGAGLETGALKREREEEAAMASVRELAQRAVRRPFSREQEARLLAEVHGLTSGPAPSLWIEDIGVLTWILACLQAGSTSAPGGRVERRGDDAVLVLDRSMGVGLVAGERFGSLIDSLKALRECGLIEVPGQPGGELPIRLGPRGRRVLKGAA